MNGDLTARIEQACQDLVDAGRPVRVTEVAARAGVDRSTLYRHAELRTLVQEHRDRSRDTFSPNGHAAVTPANGHVAPASPEQPAGGPAGSAAAPPPAHHLRWTPAILRRLISEHGKRFARFGIIGVGVFVAGLGMDVLLVKYAHLQATPAYVIQGTLAIQASFVLNYYWTWRDRRVPFWRACYRFNVQKATTAALNILLYAVLIRLGTNYLAANVFTVAIFTLINYVLGHYWAFRVKGARGLAQPRPARSQAARLAPPAPPGVSVGPTVPGHLPRRAALLRIPTDLYRRGHAAVLSRSLSRNRLPRPLILALILQAGLSLGLVWSNTAFGDEALYLWAGHLEWAHSHAVPARFQPGSSRARPGRRAARHR
jgi:putative flippase GtrA